MTFRKHVQLVLGSPLQYNSCLSDHCQISDGWHNASLCFNINKVAFPEAKSNFIHSGFTPVEHFIFHWNFGRALWVISLKRAICLKGTQIMLLSQNAGTMATNKLRCCLIRFGSNVIAPIGLCKKILPRQQIILAIIYAGKYKHISR